MTYKPMCTGLPPPLACSCSGPLLAGEGRAGGSGRIESPPPPPLDLCRSPPASYLVLLARPAVERPALVTTPPPPAAVGKINQCRVSAMASWRRAAAAIAGGSKLRREREGGSDGGEIWREECGREEGGLRVRRGVIWCAG